jgi:hypothetical protein
MNCNASIITNLGALATLVACNSAVAMKPELDAAGRAPGRAEHALGAAAAAGEGCSDRLLDDLEDGDVTSEALTEGQGQWRSYHDLSGSTLSPEEPFVSSAGGARGSRRAAHIQGRTADHLPTWAGIELNLVEPLVPQDLSAWKSLCFKARGQGPVRVNVPDINTDPHGGVCDWCYNGFGADFTLTDEWQEQCFVLEELTQQCCWGEPRRALSTTAVFGFNWATHELSADYDIWIDDVRLTCR